MSSTSASKFGSVGMSHGALVPLPWKRMSGLAAPTSIQRANTSRSANSE
jgi:hypothetical protein